MSNEWRFCPYCGVDWSDEVGSDKFGCWSCGTVKNKPARSAWQWHELYEYINKRKYESFGTYLKLNKILDKCKQEMMK